jgi:hypothetical protein
MTRENPSTLFQRTFFGLTFIVTFYTDDRPVQKHSVSGVKLRLFADDDNLFMAGKTAIGLNILAKAQRNELNSWL